MKLNNINKQLISGMMLLVAITGFTACDDYLDVRPKSQIPYDLQFKRESGFFDQLTGVYTNLCDTIMYGGNMSYGLVEVLGQNYSFDANLSNTYYNVSVYNYENTKVKDMTTQIWSKAYNCIANLNIMLEYIDKVDRNIFSGENYRVYKGEALGLRAFLHFDILRLFAPSYASNPGAPAIPYVTAYAPKITTQSTVSEAIDLTLADLNEALVLLEKDTLYTSPEPYDQRERKYYFNYYAVKIMLARVYLYKGDLANAAKYAEEIVEAGERESANPLSWTHSTSISASNPTQRDMVYSGELAFRLRLDKMEDIVKDHFTSKAKTLYKLSPDEAKKKLIYEDNAGLSDDYRNIYWFGWDGGTEYLAKFWQYEGSPYTKMFPIIRKSEAYFIAAEALKDSNPARATEILNYVRPKRNLPLHATTLTSSQIQDEVFKEYRKEFIGEGQLFYYYKRLNLSTIVGAGVHANDNVYVLPMPDQEIEYGFREY